jgi:hypothetical protein
MAFLKATKAIQALVEETSMSVVDKLMAFLDTRIEMDEDMKGLFTEFKEQLTGELKETAKAVTKSTKGATKGDKPKRAPSAYNLFIRDKLAELKESDPDMASKDRMKAATALWREHKEALEAEEPEAEKPKAAKKAPAKGAKKGAAKKEGKGSTSDEEAEEPKPAKKGRKGKKAVEEDAASGTEEL